MIMRKLRRYIATVALALLGMALTAQEVSPVDFMRLNPYQLIANPATDSIIAKLCNLESVDYVAGEEVDGATFIEGNVQYSVPLTGLVDASEEIKKLEADLQYAEGFLQGVMKKLSNASFVNNAPQKVVDMERKKQADAEEKIRIIKEQLAKLK